MNVYNVWWLECLCWAGDAFVGPVSTCSEIADGGWSGPAFWLSGVVKCIKIPIFFKIFL